VDHFAEEPQIDTHLARLYVRMWYTDDVSLNLKSQAERKLGIWEGFRGLKATLLGPFEAAPAYSNLGPDVVSLSFQDIIDLADASGVPTLREPAVRMTSVTAENADSWLDWLSRERGGNLEPIRQQVVQLQKDAFLKVIESVKGETLSDEKLGLLRDMRHEKLQGV
jgi:hypothetical protein